MVEAFPGLLSSMAPPPLGVVDINRIPVVSITQSIIGELPNSLVVN